MVKINFNNMLRQIIPPLKRQSTRELLFKTLISPLIKLWTEFVKWRNDQRLFVNIFGCRIVLEGFLRHKYDTNNIHILLRRNNNNPRIGLRSEGRASMHLVGFRDEIARLKTFLRNENNESITDVDFIVYIPAGIDLEKIRADIERCKPVFSKYTIIITG